VRDKAVDVAHIQYQATSFDQHPMITLIPFLIKCRSSGMKAKVVITMHEFAGPSIPLLPSPARRCWLLPLLLFSNAVVVTNEHDLFYMLKVPVLRNRVRLIPLGVSIQGYEMPQAGKCIIRKHLGLDEADILLVRFGFIDSVGGRQLDVLLYAIKHVCERGHKVKMLFVGGDHSNSRVEMVSLARLIGIEDRLIWTGFCPPEDVSSYLACADIGVFPFADGASEKRSSLLAAMALGLPIVSTMKSLTSVLAHRDNILLVPPGDPVSLADAIEELINNEDLRRRLSANARSSLKEFCWEKIGNATDALYRSLAE